MTFININHPEQGVSFPEAVVTGLGKGQGLFFPEHLPVLTHIPGLLTLDFVSRSTLILQHLIGDSMTRNDLESCVKNAFDFPLELQQVSEGIHALELFHGPSLAFKDFGAWNCFHAWTNW